MDKNDKKSKLEQELGQVGYQLVSLKQQFELNLKRQNELMIVLTELYKKGKANDGNSKD